MKKSALIYWLIPAKAERELFRKIIAILADQFSAPRFEPHLTLFATPGDRKVEVLRQIRAKPIRLQVRGISYSNKFTKTLFVRFNSSKSLEELIAKLGRATKSNVKAPIDPHLSLLYKKLSPSVKKELASTINLPFDEVTFDSLKAVRCVSPARTRADVEAWQAVANRKLTH